MSKAKVPQPPPGTGPNGTLLWRDVMTKYELEQHETALLIEMCRTVDMLDRLAQIIEQDGLMVPGPGLSIKAHPALIEARALRLALARLSASLRLPSGEEEDGLRRPQRRGAARGVYGLRAVP